MKNPDWKYQNYLRTRIIDEAGLRSFLESGEANENKFCDFKGGIPSARDEQHKKEEDKPYFSFCKAMCAFANSLGGFLIVGVHDKTLELQGCSAFPNVDNRVDDLKKLIRPKPEVQIIANFKLRESEKRVYILEIFPSASFKKPHFFSGKIFFRVSNASKCEFITSPEQLAEEVRIDCFHRGSVATFLQYVNVLRRDHHNLGFPYVEYSIAIKQFLYRLGKANEGNESIALAISTNETLGVTLKRYKKQSPYLSTEGITDADIASDDDVEIAIDMFETAFVNILRMELSHE